MSDGDAVEPSVVKQEAQAKESEGTTGADNNVDHQEPETPRNNTIEEPSLDDDHSLSADRTRKRDDGGPSDGEAAESGAIERRNSDVEQPRKRLRAGAQQEEKRRGQRLFGSLLGTLGGIKKEANSAKAQERAARQAELEQRQKERLQKAADEMAQKQAEAEAERAKKAQERREAMEVERAKARQAHQVKLAGFLVTKNKPQLYYVPWRLTAEQESKIEAQIQAVKSVSGSKPVTGQVDLSHNDAEVVNHDAEMADPAVEKSEMPVEAQEESEATAVRMSQGEELKT